MIFAPLHMPVNDLVDKNRSIKWRDTERGTMLGLSSTEHDRRNVHHGPEEGPTGSELAGEAGACEYTLVILSP